MTKVDPKYRILFFFDYGAGGCLWADDEATELEFGFGPIDSEIARKTGKIHADTLQVIEQLDLRHKDYLNKEYPPDPSLWRQSECNSFNQKIDTLLKQLSQQLSPDFTIVDKQSRYEEDVDLDKYLENRKKLKHTN